ncbi:MAG TPA: YfiR family protein [Planctomycetota bacterium]|nr:YfiR family protein [Planctomycetota bacterium]
MQNRAATFPLHPPVFFRMAAAACLFCSLLCACARGEDRNLEYQVKAGFLYNFTKFVDWPREAFASATDPIVITIFGADPFGQRFDDAVKNETTDGRKIVIRRVRKLEDIEPTHLLYISNSEVGNEAQILAQVRRKSIVTVGESNDFIRNGGMIRFVMQDGKVRFIINAAAERESGVTVRSQLKRLATAIVDSARQK